MLVNQGLCVLRIESSPVLSIGGSPVLSGQRRRGCLPDEREPLLPKQRLSDEALLVPDVRGRVHGE